MADKEEWIVDGYQFGSAKDATQAKAELLKIQKLALTPRLHSSTF